MMKKILFILCFLICFTSASLAAVIFNLRDTMATAEVESGTILREGITVTLAANDGVLNQTSSAFGVNATASGDDTDTIDNGSGVAEAITITFDQDVMIHSITLSLFSASESASLNINGVVVNLADTGSGIDLFDSFMGTELTAGSAMTLSHISGNGFSVDQLSVDLVPEPSSFLLLSGSIIGACCRRTRVL